MELESDRWGYRTSEATLLALQEFAARQSSRCMGSRGFHINHVQYGIITECISEARPRCSLVLELRHTESPSSGLMTQ